MKFKDRTKPRAEHLRRIDSQNPVKRCRDVKPPGCGSVVFSTHVNARLEWYAPPNIFKII